VIIFINFIIVFVIFLAHGIDRNMLGLIGTLLPKYPILCVL
jgi:hypothetical protein